jgi:hypothetical protein
MQMRWFDRDARAAVLITWSIWLLVWIAYAVTELLAGRTRFIADVPSDLIAVSMVAALAFGLYPLARVTAGWPNVPRWIFLFSAVLLVAR